jgi:membrane-bound lytic murein transglycosylase MltF
MTMMMKKSCLILMLLALSACGEAESEKEDSSPDFAGAAPANQIIDSEENHEALAREQAPRMTLDQIQEELDIPVLSEPWTGDLDGMVERRLVRVLTVYGLGRYYVDNGREKGMTYELMKMFEEELNKKFRKKTLHMHVVFIPVARDELIRGLVEGRGDIAAAGLTITPERQELIEFSDPMTRTLSEILVTGPSAPEINQVEDLAGREVYVRASSSYRSSLDSVNKRFREQGLEEIVIRDISEHLEDEDLLEMVNAGSLEWAVVDDYKGNIWAGVFENLVVRKDIEFRSSGQLGFAMRKDSPKLRDFVNGFVKGHRQGTLKGNILIKRYVDNFDWSRNILGAEDYERFLDVVDIFEQYGNRYGIDYLIVTAQGYQESQLKQSARSKAGAVGIMQLLPSTAADPNVGISDISTEEANIHAGIRYLDFLRTRYFSDLWMDEFNRTLFALAAYNAGPARVAKLRKKAATQGYDPDKWFDNVEVVAAKEIGRETVQYVSNILKYYVVYRLSIVRTLQRQAERKQQGID